MPVIRGVNYEDPPVRYRGERILALARKLATGTTSFPGFIDENLAATVYYMMFLPFPVVDRPEPGRAAEKEMLQYMVVTSLTISPKFHRVRQHTIADTTASLAASAVFIEALAKELNRNRGEGSSQRSSSRNQGDQGRSTPSSEEALQRSVEKALEAAQDVARHAKEISEFASSFAAGSASSLSFEDSIQDVITLARNTDIRTVLEALRTIEDENVYIKVKKTRSPRGELDGYEKGNDVERVVASELVLPEDMFILRYAERSLLLYRKVVGEDYGPFYVLLDKSGSMMGMKMIWAKAVALALAQRAARERREFYLRFFDSIPYPPLHISKRIHGRDITRLLDYVARIRANGGTDITRAIITATDDILNSKSRHKPSDIVLITDGEDRIAVDMIKRSLARANARLYTIMIYGNNPDLRRVSESYMVATKLSKEEALKVITVGD